MIGLITAGSLVLTSLVLPISPATAPQAAQQVRLGPPVPMDRDQPVSRAQIRKAVPKVRAVRHGVKLTPRSYARSRLSAAQFSCLDRLFYRESQWKVYADNPSSSAYGIPQALPGHRMASAGADWRTNGITQVKWGMTYIAQRYGTPCAAWAHSENHGWY